MSTFFEKIVLPLVVVAITYSVFQSKLDWWQKGSAVIMLLAMGFFIAHTLSKQHAPPPASISAPVSQQEPAEDLTNPIASASAAKSSVSKPKPQPTKGKVQIHKEATAPTVFTESKTQRPSVSAPNGVAIGGNNYGNAQVTNNNYGPRPLPALTASQLAALTAAVEPYKGTKLTVAWESGNRNTEAFVQQITQALSEGGLEVVPSRAMIQGLPDGSRLSAGISFSFNKRDTALIQNIAQILASAGLLKAGRQFPGWIQPESPESASVIYLAPLAWD